MTTKPYYAALIFIGILVGSAWPGLVEPARPEVGVKAVISQDSTGSTAGDGQGRALFDPSAAGIDEYLAYAAGQNPALKAAYYRWQALVEKSGYAGALPEPTISYTHYIENVETRVGPQEQRFSLRQTFPWFGTLGARKDISSETARAAYENFHAEKVKLFYEIKSAYYEYYYLGRDLAISRANLELLTFWESITRAKYRVNLIKHPDVIRAQVELGKMEDRVRTIENMAGPAAAGLRAALNLPDSVQLPLPSRIDIEETALNRDRVMRDVLTNNPDLKSLAHVIDRERAGLRLAGKMSLPNFMVGVDYIQTGDAIDPAMIDSGKDPWMVSVGMSVPIWFGANKARQKEAQANHRRAEYTYRDAQNQLKAFVEKVFFDFDDALRKIRLYRDGLVPKAEQSLNANYTAYQAGETDFLNLLDAQARLLDFQLQYERSRVDLALSRARLDMLMGTDRKETRNE
jgi:outer membrane protein TolC